jgi:hypothetical protein
VAEVPLFAEGANSKSGFGSPQGSVGNTVLKRQFLGIFGRDWTALQCRGKPRNRFLNTAAFGIRVGGLPRDPIELVKHRGAAPYNPRRTWSGRCRVALGTSGWRIGFDAEMDAGHTAAEIRFHRHAYGSMHRLNVEVHYLSCESGVGRANFNSQ